MCGTGGQQRGLKTVEGQLKQNAAASKAELQQISEAPKINKVTTHATGAMGGISVPDSMNLGGLLDKLLNFGYISQWNTTHTELDSDNTTENVGQPDFVDLCENMFFFHLRAI